MNFGFLKNFWFLPLARNFWKKFRDNSVLKQWKIFFQKIIVLDFLHSPRNFSTQNTKTFINKIFDFSFEIYEIMKCKNFLKFFPLTNKIFFKTSVAAGFWLHLWEFFEIFFYRPNKVANIFTDKNFEHESGIFF